MKGIVFSEFISMVENEFSIETADEIITASNLKSEGAYTTVGTYPHEEMVELVSHLSTKTNIAVPELLRAFGNYLFQRFTVIHADYIVNHQSAFELLKLLDGHIHVEVRKLYTETELPSFEHEENADGSLILIYKSRRALADFAQGLLEGCVAHFQHAMQIERQDIPEENGAHSRFTLRPMKAEHV